MKKHILLATAAVIFLSTMNTALARGPGAAGGSFGSGPPSGGFGYQGPQFGYQGPAFGDSRSPAYGTPRNRSYGTAAPPPGPATVQQAPEKPGSTTPGTREIDPRDQDY